MRLKMAAERGSSFNRLTEFPKLESPDKSDGLLSKIFWWKKDTGVTPSSSQGEPSSNGMPEADVESLSEDGFVVSPHDRSGQSSLTFDQAGPGSITSNLSDTSSTICQTPDVMDSSNPFLFEARTVPTVLKRISSLINAGSTNQSDMKKYWMPDSVSKECYECAEKFTTFRRKHHCRICGQIFCSRCCNKEIPGKIVGYAGDLRVCTYCAKIISKCLQVSDNTDEFKGVVQEALATNCDQPGHQAGGSLNSPFTFEPPTTTYNRSLPRRKISVGYQEEKFATSRAGPETIFDTMGGGVVTEDKQTLKQLWEEMTNPVTGVEWATHRHNMMKNFPLCAAGSEIIEWLMRQRKVKSRLHGMHLGQLLIDSNLLECVSQSEQIFQDAYVLYRQAPLEPVVENPELDQNSEDGTAFAPHCDNQDPLWVTQISSSTNSEHSSAVGQDFSAEPKRLPLPNSKYSLDLNLAENVVSMSKPTNGETGLDSLPTTPSTTDGSMSVVSGTAEPRGALVNAELMTDEFLKNTLLQQKDYKKISTPPMGWHSPQQLTTDEDIMAFQGLCNAFVQHENEILNQLLASMNLSQDWADIVLPLVQRITEIVKPDLKHGEDQMDIRQYVQFKKLPGGEKRDCKIVNGVVCTKNIANRAMKQRLKDPKILLIGSAIDYQRDEEKLQSLETLVMQERDYSRNAVARIASLQPDLVLVEKSVSRTAQDLMLQEGITLVINVKAAVMERVARCTQGAITTQYSANQQLGIGKPQLGLCHNFYVSSYEVAGDDEKNLMFFDGCAMHLGCTVLLRGGTEMELRRVKSIMTFLTYVSYNWRLERSFHIDSYAMPPSPKKKEDEDSFASAAKDLQTPEVSSFTDPLQGPLVPAPGATTTSEQGTSETSFIAAIDKVQLSASPFIKYSAPYLESDQGKICGLRKFFPKQTYWSKLLYQDKAKFKIEGTNGDSKDTEVTSVQYVQKFTLGDEHLFVGLTITMSNTSEEVAGSLAEFRRNGGRLGFWSTVETPEKIRKKTPYTPSRLSPGGRVDALDLFQHQKLPVLFCSFSRKSSIYPSFCVEPWVVNMEFYGRNDISLGQFLEKYCFRLVYKCPRKCDAQMLEHLRRFVHKEGCVEVAMKELQSNFDENGRNILMWSCCSVCKSNSPIVTMSSDAWCMSFAKYLELRFHGDDYRSRGCERCKHSLHQSHVHYFAQGNVVSSFAYSRITLWEICLPATRLKLKTAPKSLPELIDDVKSVAITGHGVHSSISDVLSSLRETCNSVSPEIWIELSETLKREKADFKIEIEKIQILLAKSPNSSDLGTKKESEEHLWSITDAIGFLRSRIAEAVQSWNTKLQDYVLQKKKDERQAKIPSKSDGDYHDMSTKSNKTESEISPVPNATSLPTSGRDLEDSLRSSQQDIFEQSCESAKTESNSTGSGSTVDMSMSVVLEELVSDQSNESRLETGKGLILNASKLSNLPADLQQSKGASDNSSKTTRESHSVAEDAPDTRTDKRPTNSSMKTIMSHFLSSSGNGHVLQSPWAGSEHHYIRASGSLPVPVYENEHSSIAAFTLSSDDYAAKLHEINRKRPVQLLKPGAMNEYHLSMEEEVLTFASPQQEPVTEKTTSSGGDSGPSPNVEVQFQSTSARFYCRVYFAEEFRQLRRLCLKESEQMYIRSISRCAIWNATGGKSGSTFCKTLDDRFVVKQMSKTEIHTFLDFAPNYVQYVCACVQENKPTVLAKILGVYRIGFKNSVTMAQSKMDILVMENLFYERSISLKFDLKGSERNRLAAASGKDCGEVVLLDENLMNRACENPLYIRPHTKTVLTTALTLDSAFLASQGVMDYSLLVGFDNNKRELVVGIIDYIRTYTFDKKLETLVKSVGSQGKAPTVVSPNQYQSRFTQAMDRYFLLVPDRWMGLGLGVDS